jgi:vesicular inhibitory amino acid transporter
MMVSLKGFGFSCEALLHSSCSTNSFFPQSNFRQSIDLYCSVPSPSITSLGTPSLSRLSSSFLSSSLTRRHTHEIFPSATPPLLPTAEDEQKPHQIRSSHSLLPPTPSWRGSGRKSSIVTHGLPVSGRSSFGQAVVNGKIRGLIFIS